jgi:hypothetical protein
MNTLKIVVHILTGSILSWQLQECGLEQLEQQGPCSLSLVLNPSDRKEIPINNIYILSYRSFEIMCDSNTYGFLTSTVTIRLQYSIK